MRPANGLLSRKAPAKPGTSARQISGCALGLPPWVGGLSAVLVAGAAGCPIWNGSGDDQQTVGSTAVALPLDKSINRAQESLLGDVLADAYLSAAEAGDAGGVGALFNGGSIRCEAPSFPANADNNGCSGLSVDAGSIDGQTLQDILPFESEDNLVVVRLTGAQLASTLERSVSALPAKASGWFMQVSGLGYTADCSQPAQVIDPNYPGVLRVVTEGSRITSLEVGGAKVDLADTTTTYPIVTNSFEAEGTDGHVAMALACQAQGCEPFDPGVNDYVEVGRYLVSHDPVDPSIQGRITLSASCRIGP
ncbi:MAG: 5'-nucleotidase C-terminal domain-containing protein [Myxococcales bacterium]